MFALIAASEKMFIFAQQAASGNMFMFAPLAASGKMFAHICYVLQVVSGMMLIRNVNVKLQQYKIQNREDPKESSKTIQF